MAASKDISTCESKLYPRVFPRVYPGVYPHVYPRVYPQYPPITVHKILYLSMRNWYELCHLCSGNQVGLVPFSMCIHYGKA